MSAITLHQPSIGEEVIEGEVFATYTKEDIDRALSYKNKTLGKTQFYAWLKYCEIRPNRSNCYSQDDYDRLLYFASLMKRYCSIESAKLKFHQRYPEQQNDIPKQAQRSYTYQSAPASDIASAFGF
jgi:hypothetical protein